MGEAPKKKRGLLRRSVGTFGRGSAKVIGTTAKVTAKGAKGAGRTAIHGARKAFPREEGESIREYRFRMAKLGFKVSLWTGTIVSRSWKLGFLLFVVLAIGIVITFVGIMFF